MDSSVSVQTQAGLAPGSDRLQHLPPPGPKWILWLLWGFVLAWPAVGTVIMIFFLNVETDFQELYENGRRVIQTWRLDSVYHQATASTFYPPGSIPGFLRIRPDQELPSGFYPPSAMPVYMLWSAMPPPLACFVSCAVYGLLFFLALRLLPAEALRVHPRQTWHAWLFLALVAGGYITYDITTGQVSGIPVFALVAGYVFWRRGWIWRGAAALAAGIAFKLLPGAAVLFFLLKRQWKMVFATGLLSLAFGVLPGLVMFGPVRLADGWRAYYQNVAWPKSHPVEYRNPLTRDRIRWTKPASFLNPSLSITLLRWLSDYPRDYHAPFLPVAHLPQKAVYRGYQLLMLTMGIVTFWMCRRRIGPEPPEALTTQYGLVLLWMVLLSPHLAVYYMAWALWPVAVMMGYVARRDLLERRPDRLNALAIWAFALSFPLSTVSVLRAVGMHPAVLLAIWIVLLANLCRKPFGGGTTRSVPATPGRECASSSGR